MEEEKILLERRGERGKSALMLGMPPSGIMQGSRWMQEKTGGHWKERGRP
jgi:hypothetical protein